MCVCASVFFIFIYLCVYLFMYLFIYLSVDLFRYLCVYFINQITFLFIFYRSKAHLGRLFHSLRTTFLDVDFRINSIGCRPLG